MKSPLGSVDPLKRLLAARTKLVFDEPFFGSLALRLELKEDPTCETAWVDGRTLGYNPEYVASLPSDELLALMVHEVMHPAMGHPWRRSGRDHKKWNAACDYAINPTLEEAGYKLPDGVLLNPDFRGKTAEWIYDRLPDGDGDDGDKGGGAPDGQGPNDQGQAEPNPQGEVRDAPADTQEDASTEDDWQQAVQQAAVQAKRRGGLPGSLDRFAKAALRPRVDWRSVLWRFVQEQAPTDYTWSMPNSRYIPSGLYLPSMRAQELGEIVWGFDTSGSVDDVLVAQFRAEIEAVMEDLKPTRVHVIYCDSAVHGIETFERGDPIELHPKGGGSTSFAPVFEVVDAEGIQPACLIYLTDMRGTFPQDAPDYPVLWATTSYDREAPFGEKVFCG